ncbi:MAG: DUF554 domain-containing protein [Ruminococcaceae bacterium]|nr:DUF554 domain-containing protein [Oscillospiraceae bacterium]
MLGTIVNALAIVCGTGLGCVLKSGIRKNYQETIMNAVALSVLLIGMLSAIKTNDLLLLIFSLVLGSILGEAAKIEDRLAGFGQLLGQKTKSTDGSVAKAFVTSSLIFCVGSMAIVGSIESGLTGNHQTLFAKAVLDGITSIFLSSTLGFGVVFSAAVVVLYQGLITLAAGALKAFLTETMITEISAVGGILIIAIGLNMLKVTKIKVGNMLPSIFLPFLYYWAKAALGLK